MAVVFAHPSLLRSSRYCTVRWSCKPVLPLAGWSFFSIATIAFEGDASHARCLRETSVDSLCPNRVKVVPTSLQATRPFPFIVLSEVKSFCCWGCGIVGNAQRCPSACGQPLGVVHQVRQIHSTVRLACS